MNQNLSPIAPRSPFQTETENSDRFKKDTSDRNTRPFNSIAEKEEKQCIKDNESYCFLIAWSILNYFIILIFAILLMTWYDTNKRSIQIRKNVLEIIRQVNM